MGKIIEKEKYFTTINEQTGEVIEASKEVQSTFIKVKSQETFYKLFCSSIGDLVGLKTATAFKVLFAILQWATMRDNQIYLGYGMKKHICNNTKISRVSFHSGLKELIKNQIILQHPSVKDLFVWNSFFIGQASLHDMAKIRQNITVEYDFNEKTLKKSFAAESATNFGLHILNQAKNNNIIKPLLSKIPSTRKSKKHENETKEQVLPQFAEPKPQESSQFAEMLQESHSQKQDLQDLFGAFDGVPPMEHFEGETIE